MGGARIRMLRRMAEPVIVDVLAPAVPEVTAFMNSLTERARVMLDDPAAVARGAGSIEVTLHDAIAPATARAVVQAAIDQAGATAALKLR